MVVAISTLKNQSPHNQTRVLPESIYGLKLNIEALIDIQSAQVGSQSPLSSVFDICCFG